MLNIRKLLTEVLLTVTNEEVKKIAQETYNEALRGTLPVLLVVFICQASLVVIFLTHLCCLEYFDRSSAAAAAFWRA